MSQPNATVKLYEVTDLTPDYTHTRWFANNDDRDDYFDDHLGQTLSVAQYVRVNEGSVKVPYPIKEVHDYQYMSIQNSRGTDIDEHIYYCFILDIEYVSDMCTKIYFKVDVIQTFIHDIGMWSAMVERCHNDTDEIGDNIIAEPFQPSDFFVNDESYDNLWDTYKVVIGVSTDDTTIEINNITYTMTPTTYYNQIYTCIRYFAVSVSDIDNAFMTSFLDKFKGEKRKEIVDMYLAPSFAVPTPDQSQQAYNVGRGQPNTWQNGVQIWGNGTAIHSSAYNKVSGYTPMNKKLFTAPFTFLRVGNGEGQTKDFAFEYWEDIRQDFPKFAYECSWLGEPSITLFPYDYKRKTTARVVNGSSPTSSITSHYNYDNALTITDYPKCAFNIDAYEQYQSQNGVSNVVKAVGSALVAGLLAYFTLGGGAAMPPMATTPNVASGTGLVPANQAGASPNSPYAMNQSVIRDAQMSGRANQIYQAQQMKAQRGASVAMMASSGKSGTDMLANQIRAKNTADVTIGSMTGKYNAMQNNHKYFVFQRMCCEPQYAQQVDEFFTMYGYAQNKIMNINTYLSNGSRPYWKYLKCHNFMVHGSMENVYKEELSSILNNGITFWFNADVPVGKYLNADGTFVNNSPTS